MNTKNKTNVGVWIFFSVLLIVAAFFILVAIAGAERQSSQPKYDPTALSTCEAPYQSEESSANLDLQYPGSSSYDAAADYAALSDAGKGIQSCEAQYNPE